MIDYNAADAIPHRWGVCCVWCRNTVCRWAAGWLPRLFIVVVEKPAYPQGPFATHEILTYSTVLAMFQLVL